MVLLHGVAGFGDELFIVLLAFAVLWLTVRLNGKKRVQDDDEDDYDADVPVDSASTEDPTRPSTAP